MIDILLQHIATMETQLAALHSQLEIFKGMVSMLTPIHMEQPVCTHTQTEDHSTFGHPDIRCTLCGEQVAPPMEIAAKIGRES
jgi:hypothetical protein